MNRVGRTHVLCLLVLVSSSSIRAQTSDGPGFDPTPVAIRNIDKTAPRPVTSMDLLNLRDLHGTQISPDGKYVAFVVGEAVYKTNSYRSGLFVVSTEAGSKPVSLGSAGPPHWDDINQWLPESPQWSQDSRHIYYRMKNAGTWQVWDWDRAGGAPVQLTHLEQNLQSYRISADRTRLVMVVEKSSRLDRKQLAERGILYDGSIQEGYPRGYLDEVLETRPRETEIWIHDLRNGSEHVATREEVKAFGTWEYGDPMPALFDKTEMEKGDILSAEFSPDRRNVVYLVYVRDVSKSRLSTYELFSKAVDGGVSIPLAVGEISEYWWTADSKEIYYVEMPQDGTFVRLMKTTTKGGTPSLVLREDDDLYGYSSDSAGRFLACTRENMTRVPEVAVADLSTAEVRTLVNINPEVMNLRLNPGKRIDVTSKYGNHRGHLVLPTNYENGKRYPLIMTLYRDRDGGFLRGGEPGDEYPIQVFAANGFAVLNFEAVYDRNHNPGDFESALLRWQVPLEGMRLAVAKLAEMGVVDPSKVGITGLSRGAEIVTYAISHTDMFQAAIASADGGFDPYFFYMGGSFWRKMFSDWGLGGWPEGKSSANWHKLSPALNAEHVHAAFLANAADSEYLAGLQFLTSLEELGKPVEMFIYTNELHLKNQPKHRYEIYERNVDWMKFWLKGEEDPDPAKAEQYTRWRELRKLQEHDQSNARTN